MKVKVKCCKLNPKKAECGLYEVLDKREDIFEVNRISDVPKWILKNIPEYYFDFRIVEIDPETGKECGVVSSSVDPEYHEWAHNTNDWDEIIRIKCEQFGIMPPNKPLFKEDEKTNSSSGAKCENSTKIDIRDMAYKLYEEYWDKFIVRPNLKLEAMREYFLYVSECVANDNEYISFEEYVEQKGYEKMLCISFEEFCADQFTNVDFMKELLGKELFEQYLVFRKIKLMPKPVVGMNCCNERECSKCPYRDSEEFCEKDLLHDMIRYIKENNLLKEE